MRAFGLWMKRSSPWPARMAAGSVLFLIGVAAGLVAARGELVAALGLLAGLALAGAGFLSPWNGLVLSLAVVLLLPFGVLPLRLGLTPSFLELALLGTLAGLVLPALWRAERRWRFQTPDLLAWAFVALSLFALLLGLGRGVNATVLHNYAKTVLGLATFFIVRQICPTAPKRRHWIAVLLVLSGLAALMGILLHAMPDSLALDLLRGLGPLGYPTSGRVLRYVEDDPHGLERAIGTSVDPNSFGGALAFAAAVALGEILAGWSADPVMGGLGLRRGPARSDGAPRSAEASAARALPQPLLLLILLLLVVCLYLTYSRAALGGFAVAALFLSTARYRRLWWGLGILGLVVVLLVTGPAAGHPVVERFRQGIAFQDLANRMRLAEYANALDIVRRYPIFGVGFGQAPEVDLTTGVSSLYLTIAERMGLVGLVAFLAFLGSIGARALRLCRRSEEEAGHILALLAGLVAALSSGLLDHYFFHLEFPHMAALLWMTLGLVTCAPHETS